MNTVYNLEDEDVIKARARACRFASAKDESLIKPNEPHVTCVHGKTLTFSTARLLLGLTPIKIKEEEFQDG